MRAMKTGHYLAVIAALGLLAYLAFVEAPASSDPLRARLEWVPGR